MNEQKRTLYSQIPTNPRQGGYSDLRLWPCYMVFSGLVLFLTPQIGMLLSVVLVAVPSFIVALKMSRMQSQTIGYDHEAWMKARELALKNKTPYPFLMDFPVYEQKDHECSPGVTSKQATERKVWRFAHSPKAVSTQSV